MRAFSLLVCLALCAIAAPVQAAISSDAIRAILLDPPPLPIAVTYVQQYHATTTPQFTERAKQVAEKETCTPATSAGLRLCTYEPGTGARISSYVVRAEQRAIPTSTAPGYLSEGRIVLESLRTNERELPIPLFAEGWKRIDDYPAPVRASLRMFNRPLRVEWVQVGSQTYVRTAEVPLGIWNGSAGGDQAVLRRSIGAWWVGKVDPIFNVQAAPPLPKDLREFGANIAVIAALANRMEVDPGTIRERKTANGTEVTFKMRYQSNAALALLADQRARAERAKQPFDEAATKARIQQEMTETARQMAQFTFTVHVGQKRLVRAERIAREETRRGAGCPSESARAQATGCTNILIKRAERRETWNFRYDKPDAIRAPRTAQTPPPGLGQFFSLPQE